MFYCIISTTYQEIGDLFCPVHISELAQCAMTAQMLLVKRDDGLTILLYIDQKIPSFTFFAEQNLWLYKTIMMHNKSLL